MPIIPAGTNGLFSITPSVSNFAIPLQAQINQQPAAFSGILGPNLGFWFGFQPNLDGFDDLIMGQGFTDFFTQPTGAAIGTGATLGTNGGVTPTVQGGSNTAALLAALGMQQSAGAGLLGGGAGLLGGTDINSLLAGLGGLGGQPQAQASITSNPFGGFGSLGGFGGISSLGMMSSPLFNIGGQNFRLVPA